MARLLRARLKAYEKWFYVGNHARLLLRHMTLRRAFNLLVNQCEYLARRESLASYPGFLKIDPSNRCHLRCPGCVQAVPHFRETLPPRSFLTLDDFKRIVDPVAATIIGISLDNLGEPLLNKELVAIIEHAKAHNIGTTIATNLSLPVKDEFLTKLVTSGLDKMTIALDGASSETYGQYRVGGSYELVVSNVQRIASLKRTMKSRTPELIWKFVVFPHNRHEAALVPGMYQQMGFDSFRIQPDRGADSVVDHQRSRFSRRECCFWLYSTMVIQVDGVVNPCCSSNPNVWRLGNALETDLRTLWNGEAYGTLRRAFGKAHYGQGMHGTCRGCFGAPDN
jgi:MoaA/NifB/PqqE/SkfB family radical SAM enzyme